jgi:type I restriction enzyme S subunit
MSCEGWKEVKLGELLNFRRGHDLPKTNMMSGNIPVVASNGIIGYHDKYTTKAPCLSIGRSGNVGKPLFINQDCWSHNTTLYVDDFKGNNPMFLYYLLTTLNLANYGGGSAVPTLNRNHIHPLPIYTTINIEEQKVIADTLSCLDDKVELNNRINKTLEEMAQAIFKSWFVDFEPFQDGEFVDSELGAIPKGWRVGTLGEIIETTISGDWGKESDTVNYNTEVYCIRGADIPEISQGKKGKMPTRYILSKNYDSKKLEASDIVVEISGGSPTQSTGRVALISKSLLDRYDKGMICTNFCRAVKPVQGYSNFIYFCWKYLYDTKVMFGYENGTTGIKNFNINGFLGTYKVILPPTQDLQHFDKMVETFFNSVFGNGLQAETLINIRDVLLPKLMSGEIRIPIEV